METADPIPEAEASAPGLFRSSKRRKVYRQRQAQNDEDDQVTQTLESQPLALRGTEEAPEQTSIQTSNLALEHQSPDGLNLSFQEVLRQRKAAQRRRGGIEFTNHHDEIGETSNPTQMLVTKTEDGHDETTADIERLVSRFAPQTGHAAETADKHMMAYIDAELAKQQRQQSSVRPESTYDNATQTSTTTSGLAVPEGRHPTALGRIHEIDLGPMTKERNIALTEAAKQRRELLRQGRDPDAEEREKPRLRRDGKPFRRKRRNSADIKRDKLVEEILGESRLDIYDDEADGKRNKHKHRHQHSRKPGTETNAATRTGPDSGDDVPPASLSTSASDSDSDHSSASEAADDRLAEAFRRDFLEQVQARRRQRQPIPGSAKAKAREQRKKQPDAPGKGPKLGGSRSARAKLREREKEEAAQAGKRR